MQGIYTVFSAIGIENVGLCIIILTLIVKLLMLPLTIKQQKFMKLSAVMNPELQKIQEKYKNKKDQQSQMAMQEETQAVYQKYGTSPTGSCLQLIIQLPILMALYRVIQNIAAYVPQIKQLYINVINTLDVSYINKTFDLSISSISDLTTTQTNSIIDALSGASTSNAFNADSWSTLISKFPEAETYYNSITNINSIGFGINLSQSPATLVGAGVVIALAIPILSGVSQYLSIKLSNALNPANNGNNNDNGMGQSMKMMNLTMPLISVVFCYTISTGVGVYWICSALFQCVQTVFINKYFQKVDVQDIIDENLRKQKKKQERKGIYAEQVKSSANINAKSLSQKANISTSSNTNKTGSAGTSNKQNVNKSAGSGGIAAKANMLKDLNMKK